MRTLPWSSGRERNRLRVGSLLHIAVDIMGGEQSPLILFEAACEALALLPHGSKITVLCEKNVVDPSKAPSSLQIIESGPSIMMDDSPLFAARSKKDSSMTKGLQLVARKEADALVTTGNTGALVLNSRLQLSFLPHISKPALLAALPSVRGSIALIDAGALVRFQKECIAQFALMGAVYQHALFMKDVVTIGLLNIGHEQEKGRDEVREALSYISQELAKHPLSFQVEFIGNLEARDVFTGRCDVVVTDGFTGNIFLKASEGTSAFILNYLRSDANCSSIAKEAKKFFCYQEYPGAVLCGVDGLVLKSHGDSTAQAFVMSIKEAADLSSAGLVSKFSSLFG